MIADKENAGVNPNVMLFSPPKNAKLGPSSGLGGVKGSKKKMETLQCERFCKGIVLEFGQVNVDSHNTIKFAMYNPDQSKTAVMEFDTTRNTKGFNVILGDGSVDQYKLSPGQKGSGVVTWNPVSNMTVATKLHLTLNLGDKESRLEITVKGVAGSGKVEVKPKATRKALAAIAPREAKKGQEKIAKVCANHAEHVKTLERVWAEKQSAVLTAWFNAKVQAALEGSSDDEAVSVALTQLDGEKQVVHSEAARELCEVIKKRETDEVRDRAKLHYNGAEMKTMLYEIGSLCVEGTYSIRDDKNIHKDLSLRRQFMDLMFSFELPYLRLGLEVVFDTVIEKCEAEPCVPGSKKWASILKSFVDTHILDDVAVRSRFSAEMLLHPTHQNDMAAELRAHLLETFLKVVLVMDNARCKEYMRCPTLFKKDSDFRTTRAGLHKFCCLYLSAQGDFVKALFRKGYEVHFEQRFIHEYDFQVSDLSHDLSDGIRLCKLMDALEKGDEPLMSSVRHNERNAMTKASKLHNVDLAFSRLHGDGLYMKEVIPKNIVNGDREASLVLLWKVMHKYEGRLPVNPARIRAEARDIGKNKKWRKSVYPHEEAELFSVPVDTVDKYGIVTAAPVPGDSQAALLADAPDLVSMGHNEELMAALITWVNAVTSQYGVEVDNLNDDLADGKALCLLVHHYYPSVLTHGDILPTSNDIDVEDEKEAMNNEKAHFLTLNNVSRTIGMPAMLSTHCSSKPPDAQHMAVFLSFMFSRISVSCKSINSAIRLQRWWKKCYRGLSIAKERAIALKAAAEKKRAKSEVCNFPLGISAKDVNCYVEVTISKDSAVSMIQRQWHSYYARQTVSRYRAEKEQELALQAEAERMADEAFAAEIAARVAREEAERLALLEEEKAAHEREVALQLQQQEADELRAAAAKYEEERREMLLQEQVKRRLETELLPSMLNEECEKLRVEIESQVRAEAEAEVNRCTEELEESAKGIIDEHIGNLKGKEIELEEERVMRLEAEERIMQDRELLQELREKLALSQEQVAQTSRDLQESREAMAESENREEELIDQLEAEISRKQEAQRQAEEAMQARQTETLEAEQRLLERERESTTKVHAVLETRESDLAEAKEKMAQLAAEKAAEAQARADLERQLEAMKTEKREAAEAVQREKEKNIKIEALRIAASIRIQAVQRGHRARAYLARLHIFAVFLQAAWRRFRVRKVLDDRRGARAAILRDHASRSITRLMRSKCLYHRLCKLVRGTKRLVAVARAFLARREASAALKSIFKRLQAANLLSISGPHEAFKKQARDALHALRHSTVLVEILAASHKLQEALSASHQSCQFLVQDDGPAALFTLIRSCNRSEPHQELLKVCLSCLVSVARSSPTLCQAVADVEDGAASLLDLLQMFRDKVSVFSACCELLCHLIKASPTLKEQCGASAYKGRLTGIRAIVERKHRLDERVKKAGSPQSKIATTTKETSEIGIVTEGLSERSCLVAISHLLTLL